MKVLVACEFSGIVRDAFIERGHDAVSCDLLPSDRQGPHIQGDVRDLLGNLRGIYHGGSTEVPRRFHGSWDLMIAFPPCKYICNGGNNWLNRRPDLDWRGNRDKGAEFFMEMINAPIKRIAVENPIGCMSSRYRKPDQIIRPWMFGHDYRKDTCLWLKNLPKLIPTKITDGRKKLDFWSTERHKGGKDRKAITFTGIAEAMSTQWGSL